MTGALHEIIGSAEASSPAGRVLRVSCPLADDGRLQSFDHPAGSWIVACPICGRAGRLSPLRDRIADPSLRSLIAPTGVVHLKRDPFDVRIDRGTPWGNPFSHKDGTRARWRVATRGDAIDRFAEWLATSADTEPAWMRSHLDLLRGRVLGCWCKGLACHGDVLAVAADSS